MKQPRPHIMMGQPQVLPLRERSLREQVEHYLKRMRHTVAFPCTPEQAYFGCVPPAVHNWYREGLFEMDSPLPGRATNLLETMFSTSEKQPRSKAPNVLHVSVEDQELYLEAKRGARGHEKVFWFHAPEHVPLPRNSTQTPFFLPKDHPQRAAILEWVETAMAVEQEIDSSLELIERFTATVKTTAVAIKVWPELRNFISVKRSLPNNVTPTLREKAGEVMRPTDKEALITQLARAVMLPEASPPLQAWVKFFTREAA